MTDSVLLRLGWPSSKLNPNRSDGRSHWYNAKERKAAKQEGYGEALLRGAKNVKGDRFILKVTAYPPDNRRRDDDNFLKQMKNFRDGIALAMGVDDSRFRWEFEGFERAGSAGVLIELTGE